MRCRTSHWAAVLVCSHLVACGNGLPANQPKAESPTESDEPPTTSAESSAKETSAAGEESGEPAKSRESVATTADGAATKLRHLDEVCNKIAERAQQKCTNKVANLYATNCRRYAKADSCEAEITRALECQLKESDDVLCAHQADPNCTEARQKLKVCEKGTAPIEQTQAEDLTLPSGWAKINDSELGFTVAMPAGAALDPSAAKRTWKAEDGAVTYIVAAADAPAGKLTSASILRAITNYVGTRCQLKLKVHGELELKGTTVVQYDSGCTDGTEWHGMMHFWNGRAVSTGFRGPVGNKGVREPYYYSFAISK
jgi:hypothetical protein